MSRHGHRANAEIFVRSNLDDVDGEITVGAQVVVMGVAVTLIEAQHLEHRVDDLTSADRSDHSKRNVDGHHDPARGDKVVEIGDVIAVQMRDQDRVDHSGHDAGRQESHDGPASAVDHDVLPAGLHQTARARTVGIGDGTTGAEKSDFHKGSMAYN